MSATAGGFVREFGARLRVLWPVKAVALLLGFTAFFAVYFRLLNHPVFPVTIIPLTAVDRFIGFHPAALPLYLSLWIYVPLAFVLLQTRRELRSCGITAVVLSGISFGIFFLWPTTVAASGVDGSTHPSLSFLKTVDASGNACPSLHAAFAVFTAIRLGPILHEMGAGVVVHAANWLWCAGIVCSTVAIGQHVALDVLAGTALAFVVAAPGIFRPSHAGG